MIAPRKVNLEIYYLPRLKNRWKALNLVSPTFQLPTKLCRYLLHGDNTEKNTWISWFNHSLVPVFYRICLSCSVLTTLQETLSPRNHFLANVDTYFCLLSCWKVHWFFSQGFSVNCLTHWHKVWIYSSFFMAPSTLIRLPVSQPEKNHLHSIMLPQPYFTVRLIPFSPQKLMSLYPRSSDFIHLSKTLISKTLNSCQYDT